MQGSEGRRRAFQIVSGILGAFMLAVGLFSLAAVVGLDGGERREHRIHDLASFIQLGVILGPALILQVKDPERKVALTHLALLTLAAFGVGYTFAGLPLALLGAIPGLVLVWLHPARGLLLSRGRFSVPLALLVVAAAIPLTVYALDQAAIQRTGGFGVHWSEYHWASMAALGLGLPLAGIAAVAGASAWRTAAWLAGVGGILNGGGSLLFEGYPSGLGTGAAIAHLAGSALFLAVAEWEARRAVR